MSNRAAQLAQRRRALAKQSEQLREELAQEIRELGDSTARAEEILTAVRRRASPALLIAGGAALLLVLANPARALAWLSRGAIAVTVARRAITLFRQVRLGLPPPLE